MKLAKDIALSVCFTLLFLLCVEGLLRVAGVRFEGSFYHADRDLGYALRPNAHGWNVLENLTYFTVNSDGMADREHLVPRPSGVVRIAVIGDSVSEAKQVRRDQAYWAVLERTLNQRRVSQGQCVEVLNFGVAGYSLTQEALILQSSRLWKYDPQIILLAGTIESFVLRSTRALSPNNASEHVPFYLHQNGTLLPDAETVEERAAFRPANDWFGDMMNASRLLSLYNEGAKKSAEQVRAHLALSLHANDYQESDAFLGPATPALATAWDLSEALISWSNQAARQHHAEFWLVTLDMPEQVVPDAGEAAAFKKRMGIHDLFIADRLFADFAARQNILHATLAPELQAYAQTQHVALHGFPGTPPNAGHWNHTGHRVAGELIARELLSSSPLLRDQR